MKKQSKIAAFRAPFVVTATLLVAAPGCGGSTDGGVDSGSCPTSPAAVGSECTTEGARCDSVPDGCGQPLTCVDGRWGYDVSCNPPPPPEDCPESAPIGGNFCNVPTGEVCSYQDSGCPQSFRCEKEQWLDTSPPCNPPPPPPPPCPGTEPTEGAACDGAVGCQYSDANCMRSYDCNGTWVKTAETCDDSCPSTDPTVGAACPSDGLSCPSQSTCACPGEYKCEAGVWQYYTDPVCNPPFPVCPSQQPAAGTPCDTCPEAPSTCGYGMTCADASSEITLTCVAGEWQQTTQMCNP